MVFRSAEQEVVKNKPDVKSLFSAEPSSLLAAAVVF